VDRGGLRALAAGGPDAVRVEALAKRLGVTRAGFYGSFADRDALLEAMLDAWERESTDEVDRQQAVAGERSTRARILRLRSPPCLDASITSSVLSRSQAFQHCLQQRVAVGE